MKRMALMSAVTVAFVLSVSSAAAETITTKTLVEDMINMHKLADFPSPAYKTVQFASNDRRSKTPGGVGWFDNSDGFGGEPIPNFEKVLREPGADGIGEYLICDIKGPGAIVRQWTAQIDGDIRIYLDGEDEPVWNDRAMLYLLRPWEPYTKEFGIEATNLTDTFYQKNAAYCPFPFAKGCRIVWTGPIKQLHFYQINVRLYEDGADVQTFKPEDIKTNWPTISRVATVLAKPDLKWSYKADTEPASINTIIKPKQKNRTILELEGSQAIERLTLKVDAGDVDLALRQTVMQIIFDGYPWGQVQSPIGDFFGAAPGINPYDTVPFTVNGDGTMTSRYVMPFAKSCKIIIDNYGNQAVRITGSAATVPYEWTDSSMHFRARWRVDHDIVGLQSGRIQDMPYLIANGTGVYVGSTCMLMNPNEVPSPGGSWWGEGDEKIFIDDDTQASTFGTGSEDYYNYSWSQPAIWLQPYAGQPRNDGPANRGFVTNFRWHVLDPMPFKYRMSFYMELYPHEETPNMAYARIGYHYGKPGMMDDHVAITNEDVRKQELTPNWQPKSRGGAHSSVFFQAEDILAGDSAMITFDEDRLYSGDNILVWKPSQKGDTLALDLPIENDGKYMIRFVMRKHSMAGPVSATIDGQPLNFFDHKFVDLYVPHRTLLRAFAAHDVELKKGVRKLVMTYEGEMAKGDEKAVGIDFIWLQRR